MPAHSRLTRRPRPAPPGSVSVPRPRRRGAVRALGSSWVLLGASACFDPDPPPFDGGESSTGAAPTTSPPGSSSSGDDTTTASTSSGNPDGSTTGLDSGTEGTSSTGEPVVGSSSSGDPTTGGEEPSTGEPPAEGYGDCQNDPPGVACLPSEQCVDFGNVAVCAEGCVAPGDCPVPSTGNPTVFCADYDGNGTSDCMLDCGGGQACPDGMICYAGFLCMWNVILPPGVCPDEDIGSVVPQTILGNNTGLGDAHYLSCGNGGGEDATYQFTAPFAGTYVFDTFGSPFDTMLAVITGCGGAELACNDDAMGLQSQVTVPLAAGQVVIIVVDGYSGATGPFTLNINVM
jgi:hypothetical protein